MRKITQFTNCGAGRKKKASWLLVIRRKVNTKKKKKAVRKIRTVVKAEVKSTLLVFTSNNEADRKCQ